MLLQSLDAYARRNRVPNMHEIRKKKQITSAAKVIHSFDFFPRKKF